MDRRPKLVLVRDCGSKLKKSTMRSARARRLRVKGLVHPKLPSGDDLKLVGAPLGDKIVIPLGDGAFADIEGLGQRVGGSEMSDSGGLLHGQERYSMLNHEVKEVKPGARLTFLGMETRGTRIKQLRLAKNLTQQQLADAVGVTKGLVSQWEAGDVTNPKLDTALALCEVLGTDIPYLVYGPARRGVISRKAS